MKKNSELINVLCYKLSGDVSRAVYNEYNNRWSEILHIWGYPHNMYKELQAYSTTVNLLLAMSIFYRRVLSGVNGASDFYKTVTKCEAHNQSIDIGSYRLDRAEYNKMLAIQISFRKLREKYGIEEHFFEYAETEDFLTNCKSFFYSYANRDKPGSTTEQDFPF